MKHILTILLFAPITCFAQKFWVDSEDTYSKKNLNNRLIELGFTIADSIDYDYKLTLHIKQTSKFNSTYKGHIVITDKTGKTMGETKPISRNAGVANGFNATNHIAKVIAREYLEKLTAELKD